MEKVQQRNEVLTQLKEMNEHTYQEKSRTILSRLMEDPAFEAAGTIGVTIAAFPEVDTIPLIEFCWENGKQVAVPKCNPSTYTMDFYVIENFNQLETVYMKLKEPIVTETIHASPEQIDLMIVPGVVFSRSGYRIGFGGGYYDRYLTSFPGVTRSLAFDLQIADSVPIEVHDIPVAGIHTESGFIETGR
ncbi:5-formyltetrahydrofolate cyclo-ligase [Planococcus sp. N028]|uniref:5-formyltetrahydrofolate cyclo-ligase n=1 Tax=Planococcus shixiaomingii TaxID=3058393 RepID=A0ABT8MYE0_9BACL|nr:MULTISPECIES: 5-formyltetrahydrofolate cyclo-ligase [unclassified Planococcus (in: firmicutes)]MDN7240473.1 5-formyltetrahydrofolate cyclo-ligase [Planococcus sp. N028]WKA56369.1 5-formyltetrahydrofolate cyclo-ligase [Planococcus sp. N022]